LNWKDFVEKNPPENLTLNIEKIISNSLQNNIKKSTVALALSSGIDSTLITAILRKKFPHLNIESISVTFADSVDESPNAKRIAEKFETNHHVLSLENFLLELPKAISIVKQPFWDLHWYYVVKKAKSLSNLLLSGDGGDELFGGYTFRYQKFLSLVNSNSPVLTKIISYLECHERDWVQDQEKLFGKKITFSWSEIYSILKEYFTNNLHPINQVFLADYNGKLRHNMLPLYNKIHTHFKIKNIAPLLSTQLIQLATHLPKELKYDPHTNSGKIVLRKLLQRFTVGKLVTGNKQGFSVNTTNLWKNHAQKLCKYYLTNSRITKERWINYEWISKYLDNDELDVRIINKFLGLLAFEIWYRLFISKEMKSSELLYT
jgi:asparagine synthase (glutamine-hydrolysing)